MARTPCPSLPLYKELEPGQTLDTDLYLVHKGTYQLVSTEELEEGIYELEVHGQYFGTTTLAIRSLDTYKDQKWERLKDARATVLASGCMVPKGMIQTDDVSVLRLNSAAIAASMAAPGYTIDWIMADNSVITHTAAEIIEASQLVSEFVSSVYSSFATKRTQVYEATTKAEAEEVT